MKLVRQTNSLIVATIVIISTLIIIGLYLAKQQNTLESSIEQKMQTTRSALNQLASVNKERIMALKSIPLIQPNLNLL